MRKNKKPASLRSDRRWRNQSDLHGAFNRNAMADSFGIRWRNQRNTHTSQPMSVSNPNGEFPPLASRIQSAKVQYVRNLKMKLEGIDVESEKRRILYSYSDNLLLLSNDDVLRLRDLAFPLAVLFGRDDYQKPAELWLIKVEEGSEDNTLRKDVSIHAANDALGIDQMSLQELSQVIGGRTQQIIKSVSPALFAISKKGLTPISAYDFNDIVGKTIDSQNPYDQAEQVIDSILMESGVTELVKSSKVLRQIAEEKRVPEQISKSIYEQLGIDLGEWNSSAAQLSGRSQIVFNQEGAKAFEIKKQEIWWAACGFLQNHLNCSRKAEFRDRWASYQALKPSGLIHQTWAPTSHLIEGPIIEWFKSQAAELAIKMDLLDSNPEGALNSVRTRYGNIGRDPEAILTENINSLCREWKRLRNILVCIALRGSDRETNVTQVRDFSPEIFQKWVLQNEKLVSELSVTEATKEELFFALTVWINSLNVNVKRLCEGTKAKTLEEFIEKKKISPEEESKAEEILKKGPVIIPKQTIAKKQLEVPEKGKSLDDLRRKLDDMLIENGQELLDDLNRNVDVEGCPNLSDVPAAEPKKGGKTRKGRTYDTAKDKDFIGYVGEYLVFQGLRKRYPHIGLSDWVSGNKQKFFPGSEGNDSLGYDFCIPVSDRRILIEVKSHTGDSSYFDLGSSELKAAQETLEKGDIYQVWVVRDLERGVIIDHLPNPMQKENRKHFRFEIGRVYYRVNA